MERPLRLKKVFTVEVSATGETILLCHRGYKDKHHCHMEQVGITPYSLKPMSSDSNLVAEEASLSGLYGHSKL